jgi:pimeloyl-[acyl-carrier protein] methyl ester esterase
MKVGDTATLSRRFDAAGLADFGRLAGLDDGATAPAAVPEPLIAGLFSTLLGVHLPGRGTNYLKQDLCFHAAAAADTALTASVTVTRLRPDKNLCDLATACRDETGKLIASGRALVSVRDVDDAMVGPGAAGFALVREQGRGRPIVLVHGWSAHSGFFRDQMALSKAGLRVIAPDLPGHGRDRTTARRGGAGGGPPRLADLADRLAAFLAARDLRGAVLVGWSMGATVVLDCLARHGDARIGGLVIVDMAPRITNDADWRLGLRSGLDARVGERAARMMEADWRAYAPRIAAALFAPGVEPGLAAWARRELADNDGRTMAALWRDLVAADQRRLAAAIAVPTLVVTGVDSQLYAGPAGRWFAEAIAGARHVAIAGAGHAPQLERPDAFNRAVVDFVAGLPPV